MRLTTPKRRDTSGLKASYGGTAACPMFCNKFWSEPAPRVQMESGECVLVVTEKESGSGSEMTVEQRSVGKKKRDRKFCDDE